jgi:hypothetical protein
MHGCLEAPLTILGALRGGFIPCLLPISASVQQAATLMRLVKAKAVVTVGAVERLRPADMLRNAAVESGGPRFILAFGSSLPAGTIGLDSVLARSFDAGERGSPSRGEGLLPGIMTTELQPDGIAVYRHDQEGLVAAALQIVLRSGMASGDTVLSTLAPMSQSGLVCGLVSTLLVGGILQAHPLFSGSDLMQQLEERPCSHLVVPGVLEGALTEAKVLGAKIVASTLLVHRPPARFDRIEPVRASQTAIIDLLALGERGIVAARRGTDGRPSLAMGETRIPDDDGGLVIAVRQGESGLIEVSGAAVSQLLGVEQPLLESEWHATAFRVRADPDGQMLSVSRSG